MSGSASTERATENADGRQLETSPACSSEVEPWRRPALLWKPEPLITASVLIHALALATVAVRPGRWRWAVSMVMANHGVLSGAGAIPRGRWLGPNVSRLPEEWAGPDIALTFDDGPDPDVTVEVAELLEAAGVRGTFFCIGRRLEQYPDVARRLHEAGHRLENHTFHHRPTFAFSLWRRLTREIQQTQRAIFRVTGRAPRYFRAPAGMLNPFMGGVLAANGLHLASWTRRGFDTTDSDPHRVEQRLVRGVDRGDILLLHDGNAAITRHGRAVVLEVLPRLLERLDRDGLSAGPLPDPPPAATGC